MIRLMHHFKEIVRAVTTDVTIALNAVVPPGRAATSASSCRLPL
jgi:hypothetical protein